MLNFRTFDIELYDAPGNASEPNFSDIPTVTSTAATESDKLEINEIIMFSIFGVFCAASLALVAYGFYIRNNNVMISAGACAIALRK